MSATEQVATDRFDAVERGEKGLLTMKSGTIKTPANALECIVRETRRGSVKAGSPALF